MRFLLLLLLAFSLQSVQAQAGKDTTAIKATLRAWNNALQAKNLDKALAIFDDSPQTLMVGSAPGEIFQGKEAIRKVLSAFLNYSEVVLNLSRARIDGNGNTAWVFVEGTIRVAGGGSVAEEPYRVSIVLVRRDGTWKWRLFHGDVPKEN
ncbi:MAG: SgcJ/EcaC family oxidoreductase [Chitinophagaceae bacterium]|nr:MAG: SgcJ/EcaC family oxidoreductase [Chitinophagaceae bacterium]